MRQDGIQYGAASSTRRSPCVAYDVHPEAARALVKRGAVGATSIEDYSRKLMAPAAVVDETLNTLIPFLEMDDVVIDGGNS